MQNGDKINISSISEIVSKNNKVTMNHFEVDVNLINKFQDMVKPFSRTFFNHAKY